MPVALFMTEFMALISPERAMVSLISAWLSCSGNQKNLVSTDNMLLVNTARQTLPGHLCGKLKSFIQPVQSAPGYRITGCSFFMMVPTARVQIGYRWRKKEKKMKIGRKWREKERAGRGNILEEYFTIPAGKDFGLDKKCGAFRPAQ